MSRRNHLADTLLAAGRDDPDATWLHDWPSDVRVTYADLDRRSGALALELTRRGVGVGDRVAVQADKTVDVLVLHIACIRAGIVYVPLNTGYTAAELEGILADAEPMLVVRDEPLPGFPTAALADLVEGAGQDGEYEDVPLTLDDPAAILFTSGTTGRPKGAVMTQRSLVASTKTLLQAWGFSSNDVLLHILPVFHTHGLFVAAYCATAAGATIRFLPAFDAQDVVDALPGCTVTMGVPTHYTRLLALASFDSDTVAGVRLFTSGSAPMLASTHERFRARTGQTILERYGMTETCMLTSNPLVGERRIGTVGPALPGVGLRIAGGATGDVEVRGDNVFAGYWRRPEATAEAFTPDGWFKTGDVGRLDEDGYLTLVGRSRDLIITGGLNVYPVEVEEVLDSLPGVLESAVVGLPDEDFGEAVTAVVVPRPGGAVDTDELRQLAKERLAGFKLPKRFVLVDELPRNVMGKVEKARLRRELG